MPQTYACLHYHIVFSTKNRAPLITPDLRERLWKYLAGIVVGAKGIPIQIGGAEDHVHLLVTLRQEPSLADFLRELKAGSSRWVHDISPPRPISLGRTATERSRSVIRCWTWSRSTSGIKKSTTRRNRIKTNSGRC